MSDFLQLHVLTAYPPSNPNRDDLGRPKTATIGGFTRQRISSQAIKPAIRTSEAFATALKGHQGQLTQRLGDEIFEYLKANGFGG
jgi:CRISPR system Cascade subunit CasC